MKMSFRILLTLLVPHLSSACSQGATSATLDAGQPPAETVTARIYCSLDR